MEIQIALLTVSDRSANDQRDDLSGPLLADVCQKAGWRIVETNIVPDEIEEIQQALLKWCERGDIDLILTTGGTGFSPRDVTPEATLRVVQRLAPGISEAMRTKSMEVTPHAMLSRGVTGIHGRTLIINLPGSPRAAVENFQIVMPVIPHAIMLLRGDPASEKGHQFE